MIWILLFKFAAWLLKLVMPPALWQQPPLEEVVIDPHQKCRWCGAKDGLLTAVRPSPGLFVNRPGDDAPTPVATDNLLQHTCQVCGGEWYEKPLFQDETNSNEYLHPAKSPYKAMLAINNYKGDE